MTEEEFKRLKSGMSESCRSRNAILSDSKGKEGQGHAMSPVSKDKGKKQAAVQQAPRRMTRGEQEYGMILQAEFPKSPVIFEGISLKLRNGHRYTPDFIVFDTFLCPECGNGMPLLVEVKIRGKDGFRQPSYQRAKLAFDQAKLDFPCFSYRWAEKHKGQWREK